MDRGGEEEGMGTSKQVAPPSTVSLDSTYDRDSCHVDDRPAFDGWSRAPFVVFLGLVLMAVVLVFVLDRGDNKYSRTQVEVASTSDSLLAVLDGQDFNAPQQKLVGWLKQMRKSSELYVTAGNSDMILTGALFPRNGSDVSMPFDALVSINSGTITATQQLVAIADGRGYEWNVVMSYTGDTILTSGCLMAQHNQSFPTLTSVISTARWRPDDPRRRGVEVVIANSKYAVTLEQGEDDDSSDGRHSSRCWLIESLDIRVHICIPELDEQLSKAGFNEVFQATTGCPSLVPQSANHTKVPLVPLPLRKWYASYKGQPK